MRPEATSQTVMSLWPCASSRVPSGEARTRWKLLVLPLFGLLGWRVFTTWEWAAPTGIAKRAARTRTSRKVGGRIAMDLRGILRIGGPDRSVRDAFQVAMNRAIRLDSMDVD